MYFYENVLLPLSIFKKQVKKIDGIIVLSLSTEIDHFSVILLTRLNIYFSRLAELVKEVDPTEQLDEEVQDILLQIADDFIEQTVTQACALAKHRKAPTIDARDVQLVLERNWNMWIPGFGAQELRPYKRSAASEAHRQRLAVIKKALKKY